MSYDENFNNLIFFKQNVQQIDVYILYIILWKTIFLNTKLVIYNSCKHFKVILIKFKTVNAYPNPF